MFIKFDLNGESVTINAAPETRLLDLLRRHFQLTGTKEACGEGECGSCSVLIDGKLALSCLIPAIRVQNKKIRTIESLAPGGVPHFIQKAFLETDAIQCGFCSPGLILAVKNYLDSGGTTDTNQIKKALANHLCRCTGYTNVIKAVQLAHKYQNENN